MLITDYHSHAKGVAAIAANSSAALAAGAAYAANASTAFAAGAAYAANAELLAPLRRSYHGASGLTKSASQVQINPPIKTVDAATQLAADNPSL